MQPAEAQESSVSTVLFALPPSEPSTAPVNVASSLHCRVSRDNLVPILALLQSVAEKRSTMPILTHVYVEAHESGYLDLRATDLEIGLRCRCPATVTSSGSCTVEARRVYDIVRALPAGDVQLTSSTAESAAIALTLRYEKSRFRLLSLDPREFPQLLATAVEMPTFTLPVATLRNMIDRTLFCVVTDETRPNLNGVFCEPQDTEYLRLVASDGHRLAMVERPVPGLPAQLSSVLLPAKGIAEARKLLDGATDEMATVALSSTLATLTVGDTTLTLRLGATDFPNYRAVVTTPGPHRLSIGRTDLLAALRRLLVLTTERARGVKLTLRPDILELSVASGDVGEGTEELPIAYSGPPITVGFNGRYLLDLVVAVDPADRVILELSEPTKPALLRTEHDDGYRYVVMPMQIC